jgi:hypothetical protein
MPDLDLDDLEISDDPESDDHVRMNKRDVKTLRDAAKENKKIREELDGIRRDQAITKAGLTGLSEKQRSVLARVVDDPTADNLRAEAEALGWVAPPEPDPNAVTEAELAAHQAVAGAGTGAAGAPQIRHVKPEDCATWPMAKLMRLNNQHPDLYEKLLRDEEIDLPPSFVL